MAKKEQFPPYEGRITLSEDHTQWDISVTYSHGGGVPSSEFFQSPVLMHYLRQSGVRDAFVVHGLGGYVCQAWRSDRSNSPRKDASGMGQVLLRILQKHYTQFKGRRVNWKVG